MLTHHNFRKDFRTFWANRKHKEVPAISLVPKDDPTTLFTGSGMQQFVPNLLGEPHPQGTRLFNIQPCLRAQDIEEVGNNRHDTFFEMIGNWSLGDYFKKEQLAWFYEFLTKVLNLPKERLHVTVFEGYKELSKDKESYKIWKSLGVPEERIYFYGPDKNWWSRAGVPDRMPAGEPGGPDSEVFYEFDIPHDSVFGKKCHPNCDCGRFVEIGNSVFMQYQKQRDGSFRELPKKNVDFGGGLERMLSAINNDPDQFKTDLYNHIIEQIEEETGKSYLDDENKANMRIIADHIKASVFLISQEIRPSNKEQGYILRRLIRRSVLKLKELGQEKADSFDAIVKGVFVTYDGVQGIKAKTQFEKTAEVVRNEVKQFNQTLSRGLRAIQKVDKIDGKIAFDFYQSYGFPLEITEEIFRQKGQHIDQAEFRQEFNRHRQLSRQSAKGRFKGGLADHSEQTVRYHTATHLLHQALFDVLGEGELRQDGSNITADRLRFDFSSKKKVTRDDIQKVEEIINKKVKENLPVHFEMLPKEKAFEMNARAFFKEKYADTVKIYFIGDYSKEFCGGPHVKHTNEVGKIDLYKFEKIGADLYRIYAK